MYIITSFSISGEEFTLRILCWEGYGGAYVPGFKRYINDKYGVDINIEILNVSKNEEFWINSRSMKVDIISPSHNVFKDSKWPYIPRKILLPIDLKNIPNYQYILPSIRQHRFVTEAGMVYGVPYIMGTYGLAYNADRVEKPDSWSVLWSDKAKNNITISMDFYDCNIYITALVLGADYADLYNYDQLVSSIDFEKLRFKLHLLRENTYSFWEGVADYRDFENLSYATTWGYGVLKANLNGGNWLIADPKEGSTAWIDYWAITHALKDKPIKKKLAEEWINYSLSPEVQIGSIRNWGATPVVNNINSFLTDREINIFRPGDINYWKKQSLWGIQDKKTHNAYIHLWHLSK